MSTKTAIVVTDGAHGGAASYVARMADALAQAGGAVIVLTGADTPTTDASTVSWPAPGREPVTAHCSSLRRRPSVGGDVRAYRELEQVLRRLRPDVVSLHTSKPGLLGRIAARRLGLPALYFPHGWSFHQARWPLRSVYRAVEAGLDRTTKVPVICVSNSERGEAIRKRVTVDGRARVVVTGIDPAPAVDTTEIAAAVAPVSSTTTVRLLMVARFQRPKDHRTLLLALAGIQHLPWRLTLAGGGPLEGEVRALVAQLGLDDRVDFPGWVSPVASLYRSHDVFVLSSRHEGLPLTVLEAMAHGLPIVATAVGGITEVVHTGRTAAVVPPGDVVALRGALGRMIREPEQAAALGRAARTVFDAAFTRQRWEQDLVELHHEIAAARR